jgi:RimJ/RimL family protein N-acetyltransferase
MEFFPLVGPGIVLDRVREADIDRIVEYCQDPDIIRWTTVPHPYNRSDGEAFVREFVPRAWAEGTMSWGIRDLSDPRGRLAGAFDLRLMDDAAAEVGYLIAPDYRHRGLAGRAFDVVLAYAFGPDGPGLDRVEWYAFVGNDSSRAVAERAGFEIAADIAPGFSLQRGEARDCWRGTLSQAAWLAARG